MLPNYARRYRMVVVGNAAHEVVSRIDDPHVTAVDLEDERSIDATLSEIDRFGPDVVLAFERITTWNRAECLSRLANDNNLCEMLFLLAQRNATRLTQGTLELWGLFPGAWDGATGGKVHPASGPVAGLLKAIAREMSAARVGVVCTKEGSPDEALKCFLAERSQENPDLEVAYDGTTRLSRRLREARNVTGIDSRLQLDSHSVVVATGGARGVTAVLADALLKDYRCTVVALGRSTLEAGPADADDPQAEREFYARFMREHPGASPAEMKRAFEKTRASWEAHRTIERLSALGGRVEYMARRRNGS